MVQAVKVAISLPAGLLEMAEQERRVRGESRSEFFRHALEAYLQEKRQREEIARYIKGYREQPESEEEITVAELQSIGAFSGEPWE
jgi:metal-responsive CopG/Arc/MetJ family transcriptional regulator